MKKIFSFLTAILFVGSMWAADGDTHTITAAQNSSFPQSFSLNNNAEVPDATITGLTYLVKGVAVEVRTNKTNSDVDIEVLIGTTSLGTQKKSGNSTATLNFATDPVSSLSGDITIRFTNNMGSGTGKGSVWLQSVTLTEGSSTDPEVTVDPTSWDFGDVELDAIGSDDTKHILKSIALTGANLTDDVNISVVTTGGGSIFFINGYRSEITLTPDEGAIDYELIAIASTATGGEFEGTITISSEAETPEFDDVVINLAINVVAPVAVTGVELDEDAISLEIGQTQTLVATVLPAEATNKAVTWESDDENVATVDENGKVTAVAAGDATITCKSVANNAIYAECAVNVHEHVVTPGKYDITLSNTFWGVTSGQQAAAVTSMSRDTADISLVTTKGSSQMYTNSTQTRFYGNGTNDATLAISVPSGYSITAISFTEPESDKTWNGSISANVGTYTASSKSWADGENGDNSVTFTFGAQNRVASVSVTFVKDKETAIDDTEAGVKAVKKIVNGQLLIEKNGRVYNAFGQTVK